MDAVVAAVIAALLGAGFGYYLRGREFRREHRLRTYSDFVASFLALAHAGANLLSLGFTFGDTLRDEYADRAADAWVRWNEASHAYETTQTGLRLIGSKVARQCSEELEDWIAKNIRSVPPFTTVEQGTAEWGDEAKVGPAHVDRVAMIRAREFADVVRAEIVGWRPRRS